MSLRVPTIELEQVTDNGFTTTNMRDCTGTPFNYQPEYSTAKRNNVSPWGAIAGNITTQFEIGHFEPCSNVTREATFTAGPGITDTYWKECHGPYENAAPSGDGGHHAEINDSPCFPAGDTHGSLNNAPDEVTGCLDFFTQNGDLDFDGSDYWADWPTGTSPTAMFASTFVQALPTTAGNQYSPRSSTTWDGPASSPTAPRSA